MLQDLSSQAITAALAHNWEQAVTLNQKILQEHPGDCDALNRLGYAFCELGRADEAQEIFERVLALDPRNLIATKNLIKMRRVPVGVSEDHSSSYETQRIDPNLFLEEVGKTKTCQLVRIATKSVIGHLRTGYQISLILKQKHSAQRSIPSIAVFDTDNACIGYLPDDMAVSLYRFMQGGCHYEAFIKSVSPSMITIFIREVKKSSRFKDIPSFIDHKKLHNSVNNRTQKTDQILPEDFSENDFLMTNEDSE